MGCGREGVFPRGVGVSRGDAPNWRVSRAGQALPWKSEASAADWPAGFGISPARTSSPAVRGDGWRRGGVTLQPLREEAAEPRKLWTTGLTPSPCCPQAPGSPVPLRLHGEHPILPDKLPAAAPGALLSQPRPIAVCIGLRQEGGAGRRGGPPRVSCLSHLHLFKARLVVCTLWNANCGPGLLRHLH